jgi:predicted porin
MESSESEILIRGVEKLGGGMSTWAQCASSADGVVGGNTAAARNLCQRNSAFGLQGSFGNIFFGNWDTPIKLVQNAARGWHSGTNSLYGGSMVILAGDSQSGAANTGISFYRRQANSVNYHSPNWSGFTFAAAFSASNETASIPDATGLTPRLMSVNGMYRSGPLLLGVAYEKHDDFQNAGAVGTSDDAFSVVAGYRIAGVNARVFYQSNSYEDGAGGTIDTGGFGLYVDWNLSGPHSLHFGYAKSNKIDVSSVGDIPESAAQWLNVSYSYDLSKRTQLLFAFNQIKNDNNVNFSMLAAGTTAGGKPTAIGAAVRHRF